MVRNKSDEDTRSLAADLGGGGSSERKKSDWRSRLASKFKRPGEQYSFDENEAENGVVTNSYRKTSDELPVAPMTEPTRRRTTIAMSNGGGGGRSGVTSRTGAARVLTIDKRIKQSIDVQYLTSNFSRVRSVEVASLLMAITIRSWSTGDT